MGKDKEEHKGFASPRDALSFLLNDETEAVNGYDLVLRSVPLEEADRVKLERIRNAEIDHIKDLSDIYQKYSTAKFVGTDSRSVKDSKWTMHQHTSGYFYFKDAAGSVYSENGVEKHFTDREPAGEFYIRNLYNADAWDGGVPRVIVDSELKDYSARGSFNSIGELKSHYYGATLLPEGDKITVILKSGAELVYSYVGNGRLAFVRGKN